MFERVAWARSPEERSKIRKEKEILIIDELINGVKAKLGDNKILPKSKLREAIVYFCGLIPYLKNYTEHAFARLDNNVAERAVRSLAIGRKNWLFFGSPDRAETGSILLSLVQTCRGLGTKPREYLEDVMRRIMSHEARKLYKLLWMSGLNVATQHLKFNSLSTWDRFSLTIKQHAPHRCRFSRHPSHERVRNDKIFTS